MEPISIKPAYGGYYKGGAFGPRPGNLAAQALINANLEALYAFASCDYCGSTDELSVYHGHERTFCCINCD